MVIDYLILGLYALGMVIISLVTRKRSKGVNDFLLAGKKGLNGLMSAFSYGTTYFSAVIFIGYAGKFGAMYQLASIWIGVGNAFIGALLAWKILAKRTKNMTRRLQAKTMPSFFASRYDSPKMKTVSAIIIFLFLIPYSASVYNGLSSLFEITFGIPGWVIMIALAVLTALYLFFGGYFATALSDFIQGIIMLLGVVLMIFFFLKSGQVNWDLSGLNWFTFNSAKKGIYGDTVSLISLIVLTSFGVYGLPQTVHKYYAIRDSKAIKQGTIVSTAFALIIGFGAYFVGGLSSKFFTPDQMAGIGYDNLIPNMLNIVIPVGLTGIIAVLILSASMSTLSSVSLASASVVAIDLYKDKINKKASDKNVTWTMRALCLVFVAISLTLAILNEKFKITAIAYLMGLSWGTLSGCFIGPFVLGMISKKVTKSAAWVSIVGSLILTIILLLVFGFDYNGWNCSLGLAIKSGIGCSPLIGCICMAFSILSTLIVSKFTKKPSEQVIYNAFEKPIENEIV